MTYLKIVLTIIALCLIIRCTVDYIPSIAQASGTVDVNIIAINGTRFIGWSLPVKID